MTVLPQGLLCRQFRHEPNHSTPVGGGLQDLHFQFRSDQHPPAGLQFRPRANQGLPDLVAVGLGGRARRGERGRTKKKNLGRSPVGFIPSSRTGRTLLSFRTRRSPAARRRGDIRKVEMPAGGAAPIHHQEAAPGPSGPPGTWPPSQGEVRSRSPGPVILEKPIGRRTHFLKRED